MLNLMLIEIKINTIPRYIGFREYLNIPPVTNDDAFSILIGLIVVLSFLNLWKDIRIITKPKIKKNKLILLEYLIINSGKIGLDK